MPAILHIIKKDVRASWAQLCVMGVLIIVQIAQLWNRLSLDDYYRKPFAYSEMSMLLLYLIIMMIVVRVVQEDALVGTAPFWRTRPIAGKTMLLAKGIYVFLFLLLTPVLASFILFFHFGMKSAQIIPFLFALVYIHAAILGVFAALAAVTPNWVSFAIAGAAALVSMFISNNWFEIPYKSGMEFSGMRVFGLLLIAVTFCAIAYQYLTRKTLHTAGFLILGIVLAWTSCHYSIWHSLFKGSQKDIALSVQIAPAGASGARMMIGGSGVQSNPADKVIYFNMPMMRYPEIAGLVNLQNLPDIYEADIPSLYGRLEFADGKILTRQVTAGLRYGGARATRSLFPDYQWIQGGTSIPHVELLNVSPKEYLKLQNLPGTYSGAVQLDLYRNSVVAEVPLIGGSVGKAEPPVVIKSIQSLEDAAGIWLNMERRGLVLSAWGSDEMKYFLVNHVRREAIAPSGSSSGRALSNGPLILFGVHLLWQRWNLNYVVPAGDHPADFILDEAWLKDARLVVVKRNYVQSVYRNIEIKNFRMKDYSPERVQERMIR